MNGTDRDRGQPIVEPKALYELPVLHNFRKVGSTSFMLGSEVVFDRTIVKTKGGPPSTLLRFTITVNLREVFNHSGPLSESFIVKGRGIRRSGPGHKSIIIINGLKTNSPTIIRRRIHCKMCLVKGLK